jgi:hypothetical protein
MFLREFSLCDGDKAPQPRFRCEQVVEPAVKAVVGDVVPDAEQVAISHVKESVVDVGQFAATNRQMAQLRNAPGRDFAGRDDRGTERV